MTDRSTVEMDWRSRGFSCDIWVDPLTGDGGRGKIRTGNGGGGNFALNWAKKFLSQKIWYTQSAILAEQYPAGYTVIKKTLPGNSSRAFFIALQ